MNTEEKFKKYPHADHRQRVRKAFRESDFENLPDRAVLEFLLFYAIPRRDTNPIAASLLERYGSLEAVLEAPYEELMQTPGMGESSALLLSLLPDISSRIKGQNKPVKAIFEKEEAKKYIYNLFKNSEKEEFYIICLNAVGVAVSCKKLAEGDENTVRVDKRKILETAFEADADSVIIAHNHPGGEAAPSAGDIELTKETARLLAETGIKLSDHIIVGDDSLLSLALTAKFRDIFG